MISKLVIQCEAWLPLRMLGAARCKFNGQAFTLTLALQALKHPLTEQRDKRRGPMQKLETRRGEFDELEKLDYPRSPSWSSDQNLASTKMRIDLAQCPSQHTYLA